ncbi:MAG: cell division protein ZapA [Alphaproteobacteria bacterium]
MSVVILNIADYSYKIACQDGQENHIRELASFLDSKAKKLLTSVGGYIPESQLLAMVSVLVAQELFNAKHQQTSCSEADTAIENVLDELTQRVNLLTEKLK